MLWILLIIRMNLSNVLLETNGEPISIFLIFPASSPKPSDLGVGQDFCTKCPAGDVKRKLGGGACVVEDYASMIV